jgi:hypothetical protein
MHTWLCRPYVVFMHMIYTIIRLTAEAAYLKTKNEDSVNLDPNTHTHTHTHARFLTQVLLHACTAPGAPRRLRHEPSYWPCIPQPPIKVHARIVRWFVLVTSRDARICEHESFSLVQAVVQCCAWHTQAAAAVCSHTLHTKVSGSSLLSLLQRCNAVIDARPCLCDLTWIASVHHLSIYRQCPSPLHLSPVSITSPSILLRAYTVTKPIFLSKCTHQICFYVYFLTRLGAILQDGRACVKIRQLGA